MKYMRYQNISSQVRQGIKSQKNEKRLSSLSPSGRASKCHRYPGADPLPSGVRHTFFRELCPLDDALPEALQLQRVLPPPSGKVS